MDHKFGIQSDPQRYVALKTFKKPVLNGFYMNSLFRYPDEMPEDKMPENMHGQNARKWKTGQNAR